MLHVGVKVPHEQVVQVLSAAIDELERNKAAIANPGPKDDPEIILVKYLYMWSDIIYYMYMLVLYLLIMYVFLGWYGEQFNHNTVPSDNINKTVETVLWRREI